MVNQALLSMLHVDHWFTLDNGRRLKALEDITLSVGEHEIVVLLGPSGSGKSTCLRILSGLIPVSSGLVQSQGQDISGPNQTVAMVFQNFALLPWLNIAQNIALGLQPMGLGKDESEARVKRVIGLVGLEGFEEAYPKELSGGMKQRVGFARALVMERPVLCLDEAFSALDVLTAESLRREVLNLWLAKKTRTTSILLVTHNIAEAVLMGGRILLMSSNPGSIQHEVINTLPYPRDEHSDLFKAQVDSIHDMFTKVIIPDIVPGEAVKDTVSRPIEALPPIHLLELIGFIEALARVGARQDIFVLAKLLNRDALHVLAMAKGAELLDLLDTPHNWVVLTEKGLKFAHADIEVRKKMLHDELLALRLGELFCAFLEEGPDGTRTQDEAISMLHACLPNENPEEQFDTLVQWGRFGQLFAFNAATKKLTIESKK